MTGRIILKLDVLFEREAVQEVLGSTYVYTSK